MSEFHFIQNPNTKRLQAVKDMLLSEIEWCEKNRGISGKGDDFERGFLGGLGQAVYLVEQAMRISRGLPLSNPIAYPEPPAPTQPALLKPALDAMQKKCYDGDVRSGSRTNAVKKE